MKLGRRRANGYVDWSVGLRRGAECDLTRLPAGHAQECAKALADALPSRVIGSRLLQSGEIGQRRGVPGEHGTAMGPVLLAKVIRLRLEAESVGVGRFVRSREF
jgi:hypothetical protein